MKKYTYQAKTFEEAKNQAMSDLMEQEENLYIKEIESTNKLFNKKSVIEVIKKDDVVEAIKELIKGIVTDMGLTVNMEVKKREDSLNITLYTDNNAVLIGKNARTLDALTTVIKQSLYKDLGESYKFVLDIGEYKQKREWNLEKMAKSIAREVAKTKVEAKLEPMNSYERRIIHNTLGQNKKVYTDAGMDKTISTLDYSLSDRIHTMKNKWNNLVSNDKEAALVKKILQDLNSMKTVFDLTYKNIPVSEISEIVKASIPEQYTLCESPKFSYSPFESHEYDSFFTSINSNRLESIIINLLQNSCSAIERYFYSLPIEKMMQYQGYIKLSTNIEQREGKLYYTITLEDNGGGFPEPEKIYKVPITSSDKSNGERKGAGTLYINTFVRRMNGFIEASNVVLPDNMIGAKTTIYFLLNKEVNNE